MRGKSGRNYKIAQNCLVCILDFIHIQIRNDGKGYCLITIIKDLFS